MKEFDIQLALASCTDEVSIMLSGRLSRCSAKFVALLMNVKDRRLITFKRCRSISANSTNFCNCNNNGNANNNNASNTDNGVRFDFED